MEQEFKSVKSSGWFFWYFVAFSEFMIFTNSHVPSKYNTAKWPLKSNADFEDEKSLSVLA